MINVPSGLVHAKTNSQTHSIYLKHWPQSLLETLLTVKHALERAGEQHPENTDIIKNQRFNISSLLHRPLNDETVQLQ